TGAGLPTEKLTLAPPPPGAGLSMPSSATRAVASSDAGIDRVRVPDAEAVTDTGVVSSRAVLCALKPWPLATTVSGPWPAGAGDGLAPVKLGLGLFTVKESGVEVPPPGAAFCTTSDCRPASASSAEAPT